MRSSSLIRYTVGTGSKRLLLLLVFVWACMWSLPALAGLNTFTNAGAWSDGTRWSLGHVPVDSEDVVINANVTLTNATANLLSYTISSGKTQTFNALDAVLTAAVVTVSGTVTHAINTDTNGCAYTNASGVWLGVMNARVKIACSNLTIAAGGKIDGYGKGFQGGSSQGVPGAGPGGGTTINTDGSVKNQSAGGGHIGRGGRSNAVRVYGPTYDSYTAPSWPGSGTGGGHLNGNAHGGGLVQIDATGQVLVNGLIDVRGTDSTLSGHAGGGSGGGVLIKCQTFGGSNGAIQADGGTCILSGSWWYGGGGGGGGIAIICDPVAQSNQPAPQVLFSAGGGFGGLYSSPLADDGERGSVFLNSSLLLSGAIGGGIFYLPDASARSFSTLAVTNGWPVFATSPSSITVSNNALISGSQTRFDVTNTTFLHVGGNLTVSNGAQMCGYALPTNGTTGYGLDLGVGGSFTLCSTGSVVSLLSDATNGGSVFIGASGFVMTACTTVNVDSAGFGGGYGQGKQSRRDRGENRTPTQPVAHRASAHGFP